ncbi:MAG: hypothetical protein P4L46_18935 [Fimbriimonas sp.]|nr:hypothetical protein [Fimbriimonas sp.]
MLTGLLVVSLLSFTEPSKRVVYFMDFRAETFTAVTRKSIHRDRGLVDRHTWSTVLSQLRKVTAPHSPQKRKLNEDKLRLMLEESKGRAWFVDQSGFVLKYDGSSGTLDKQGLRRLNDELIRAFSYSASK